MDRVETVKILNVSIDNLSKGELLRQLKRGIVFTPNVDHLIKLQTDADFIDAYNQADYKVCDSKILLYASRFLGHPLKEKISGSDLFPEFYRYHKHNPDIRIFLLGAAAGVASIAQRKINSAVGRSIVVGSYSPSFGFETNETECLEIVERVKQSNATVLAVGVGAPKQEKWIQAYKHLLPSIQIFLAVGATIDFEAGIKPRAPRWMSEVGFEWLYRLMTEPRRLWKRYLVDDTYFFWLLLLQKLNIYRSPLAVNSPGRSNRESTPESDSEATRRLSPSVSSPLHRS